jgi:hypothetical protein
VDAFLIPEGPAVTDGWVGNVFLIGESPFLHQAMGDVDAEAVNTSI